MPFFHDDTPTMKRKRILYSQGPPKGGKFLHIREPLLRRRMGGLGEEEIDLSVQKVTMFTSELLSSVIRSEINVKKLRKELITSIDELPKPHDARTIERINELKTKIGPAISNSIREGDRELEDAMEMLKELYKRGKISKDEFDAIESGINGKKLDREIEAREIEVELEYVKMQEDIKEQAQEETDVIKAIALKDLEERKTALQVILDALETQEGMTPEEFATIEAEFEQVIAEEEISLITDAEFVGKRIIIEKNIIAKAKKEMGEQRQPETKIDGPIKSRQHDRMLIVLKSEPDTTYELRDQHGSGWMVQEDWNAWYRWGFQLNSSEGRIKASNFQVGANQRADNILMKAAVEEADVNLAIERERIAWQRGLTAWLGEKVEELTNEILPTCELPESQLLVLVTNLKAFVDGESIKIEEKAEAIEPPAVQIILDGTESKIIKTPFGTWRFLNKNDSGWMTQGDWNNWWRRANPHGDHEYDVAKRLQIGYNERAWRLMEGQDPDLAEKEADAKFNQAKKEQEDKETSTGIRAIWDKVSDTANVVGRAIVKDDTTKTIVFAVLLAAIFPLIILALKAILSKREVELTDDESEAMGNKIAEMKRDEFETLKVSFDEGEIDAATFQQGVTNITERAADELISDAKAEKSGQKRKKIYMAGGAVALMAAILGGVGFLKSR